MFIPMPIFQMIEIPYLEYLIVYFVFGILLAITFQKMENEHRKQKEKEKITLGLTLFLALAYPIIILVYVLGDVD